MTFVSSLHGRLSSAGLHASGATNHSKVIMRRRRLLAARQALQERVQQPGCDEQSWQGSASSEISASLSPTADGTSSIERTAAPVARKQRAAAAFALAICMLAAASSCLITLLGVFQLLMIQSTYLGGRSSSKRGRLPPRQSVFFATVMARGSTVRVQIRVQKWRLKSFCSALRGQPKTTSYIWYAATGRV